MYFLLPSELSSLAILKTVHNICFGEKKRYVLNTIFFFFFFKAFLFLQARGGTSVILSG